MSRCVPNLVGGAGDTHLFGSINLLFPELKHFRKDRAGLLPKHFCQQWTLICQDTQTDIKSLHIIFGDGLQSGWGVQETVKCTIPLAVENYPKPVNSFVLHTG